MKKIALFAAVSSFALALSACGDSGDASEDSLAESVELPADEAMADAPMPTADATEAADDAEASPDEAAKAEDAGDAAVAAAADAQAAADAAEAATAGAE